jgi:pimeloyl-ACP methyl ester carboxylesterase/cbb3-type cytochrome oxidase subunit 3
MIFGYKKTYRIFIAMMVNKTIFIILFIICGLMVAYVILDPEKKELNEAARSRLGGSYIRLSQGVTHYSLEGPENGRSIVLVHGAIIPMFCWDELSPALTKAGFRVLCYDMYGRGYSDRPEVTYDRELYCSQLRDLLDALKIHEPVDLIGVSMGAGIICDFSAQYPERVDRIGFISPLVNDVNTPLILQIPVLGECAMRFIGLRRIAERANSLADANSPQYKRQAFLFTDQVTYRGFQASFYP